MSDLNKCPECGVEGKIGDDYEDLPIIYEKCYACGKRVFRNY